MGFRKQLRKQVAKRRPKSGIREKLRVKRPREKKRAPSREAIVKLLKNLKSDPTYAPVIGHCLLCEIAAKNVAKQLRDKDVDIEPGFVSRAALTHDVFRNLRTDEVIEHRIAARRFEKQFPEFANIISATHALHKLSPMNLNKLTLEQKIMIYCDNVCRGIPTLNEQKEITGWVNNIYSLKGVKVITDWRILMGKWRKVETTERQFWSLENIETQLKQLGLDTEKLRRETRREFKRRKGKI